MTGADVEFIKALSTALSFVPSLLCKTSGVDLSRPSGYRLITSRDWEVLRDSKYKSCQCSACYVRAPVPGKTGTTKVLTHNLLRHCTKIPYQHNIVSHTCDWRATESERVREETEAINTPLRIYIKQFFVALSS